MTALSADLILPTAMWVEKEGAYGNAERRTQFWREQISPPGEARSDVWQLMEFSKRFTIEDVWPEELIAQKPDYKGKIYVLVSPESHSNAINVAANLKRLRNAVIVGNVTAANTLSVCAAAPGSLPTAVGTRMRTPCAHSNSTRSGRC